MAALLLLVIPVCLLLGFFAGWTAPHWLQPDPYDQLAKRDRARHA